MKPRIKVRFYSSYDLNGNVEAVFEVVLPYGSEEYPSNIAACRAIIGRPRVKLRYHVLKYGGPDINYYAAVYSPGWNAIQKRFGNPKDKFVTIPHILIGKRS